MAANLFKPKDGTIHLNDFRRGLLRDRGELSPWGTAPLQACSQAVVLDDRLGELSPWGTAPLQGHTIKD